MNRRIPDGTYGGVRGRGLDAPTYSIYSPCLPHGLALGTSDWHSAPPVLRYSTQPDGGALFFIFGAHKNVSVCQLHAEL